MYNSDIHWSWDNMFFRNKVFLIIWDLLKSKSEYFTTSKSIFIPFSGAVRHFETLKLNKIQSYSERVKHNQRLCSTRSESVWILLSILTFKMSDERPKFSIGFLSHLKCGNLNEFAKILILSNILYSDFKKIFTFRTGIGTGSQFLWKPSVMDLVNS